MSNAVGRRHRHRSSRLAIVDGLPMATDQPSHSPATDMAPHSPSSPRTPLDGPERIREDFEIGMTRH